MNIRQMVIQMTFRVISNGLRGANEIINRLRNGAGGADGAIRRMSAGMQKLNGAAGALVGTLGKVAAAMGVAFSAVAIKNAADEAMNLDNKLRVIYKDDEQGRRAMKDKIFDMANDARGSYTATGDLFYKVARTSETTGLSLDESARLAEIVSKGLSLSGADTGTAEGAILQLGQALSSGVLQGDELHALNEGAGALMQEMAKSMGVKIGDLKEMGKNGELTSDRVARAILASGDEIDRQFATHVPTIGQAMQTISNTWTKTMGDIQDRTNVFGAIAEGLISGIKYVGGQVHAFMDLLEGKDEGRAKHPVLAAFVDGVKLVKNEIDYVKGSIKTFFSILAGDEDARMEHPALAAFADAAGILRSRPSRARGLKFWRGVYEDFLAGVSSIQRMWANWRATLEALMPVLQFLAYIVGAVLVGALYVMHRSTVLVFRAMATALEWISSLFYRIKTAILSMGFDWDGVYAHIMTGFASLQKAWASLQPLIEALTPLCLFLADLVGTLLVNEFHKLQIMAAFVFSALQIVVNVIGYALVYALYHLQLVSSIVFRAIAKLIEWVSALLGGLGEMIKWLADGLTSILTLGSAVGNMKMPEHQWGDWKNAGGGGYSVTNNKSVYAPQYFGLDPISLGNQPEKDVLNFAKGF